MHTIYTMYIINKPFVRQNKKLNKKKKYIPITNFELNLFVYL
jgi:hypothetical protein